MVFSTWRRGYTGVALVCCAFLWGESIRAQENESGGSADIGQYLENPEDFGGRGNEYITLDVRDKDLSEILKFISRRVEAPTVKAFLHRMALEDRDHGRILRRHRADLDDPANPEPIVRRMLPTHIEIRGEMGYYRAVLTAVQMKAEAAEYYRKLAPAAENRYIRTFLQILANREEEQRDILADMLDAQRSIGFNRTKSGKIIPTTPTWLGMYLLDDPEE